MSEKKEQKFLEFIADIFNVEAKELSLETKYEEHEKWDSLMHLRLVSEIEEEYSIEIPIDLIQQLLSLREFYKLIG